MANVDEVPYVETDHLRDRVNHLADGLLARLREISISEYPNETPRQLVGLVIKIIDKVKVSANETSNPDLLGLMSDLLKAYGQLLRYLDNANTEQTPRALTGMLEWLYAKLDINHTLLACPQSAYNYSIVDLLNVVKKSSKHLLSGEDAEEIFGDTPAINLISFPRIERDNVLLHAIFGHEIGHPFADQYLSQDDIGKNSAKFQAQLTRATARVEKEISNRLDPNSQFADQFDVRSRLVGQVIEIRRRGLQELLSDAVSVQVFGPSAIFAAREIFMTSSLDAPPELPSWYPPDRYRLRLMINVAKELGHWATLKKVAPHIDDSLSHLEKLVGDHSDTQALEQDLLTSIAYDWLAEVLDDAVEFTLNLTKAAAYSPKDIENEVPKLLRRVPLDIPPSEIGFATKPTSVDWRSSILASWVYRFHQLGSETFDATKLLNITRKAIEHVLLREKFSEVRGA